MPVKFKLVKGQDIDVAEFTRTILKTTEKEAKKHKEKLEATVATWRDKPSFESRRSFFGSDLVITTGPTGSPNAVRNWIFANEGTKAHTITAKNSPTLKYKGTYSPKTRVGQFRSFKGGASGDWVSQKSVQHPGVKARGWTKILAKEREGKFPDDVGNDMRRMIIACRTFKGL